ncbi:MAG: hypothetical protein RLZZ50_1227 [Verrucomicrobiota bacterium]
MRSLVFPLFSALALTTAAAEGAPQVTATAPVKNFRLPTFTDEGWRRLMVVAAEARLPDPARIDLVEMELTLFTGRADEQIDAMLAAPVATFLPEKQFASGAESVRLERTDISVTGVDWSYDHAARKIVIRREAHVTFHAALGDILK